MPHGITQCYLPPGRGDFQVHAIVPGRRWKSWKIEEETTEFSLRDAAQQAPLKCVFAFQHYWRAILLILQRPASFIARRTVYNASHGAVSVRPSVRLSHASIETRPQSAISAFVELGLLGRIAMRSIRCRPLLLHSDLSVCVCLFKNSVSLPKTDEPIYIGWSYATESMVAIDRHVVGITWHDVWS